MQENEKKKAYLRPSGEKVSFAFRLSPSRFSPFAFRLITSKCTHISGRYRVDTEFLLITHSS